MLTDWVLIGRLARELDERLGGARVQDVGLLDDARIALIFRSRGDRVTLAVDLFASPPLVTIEDSELAILEEPGFVRALARTLNGTILAGVAARRFDRLLRLRFSTRSRFGVGDELDLYLELVPRFGNAVLVKGSNVVAARKEFAGAQNSRRAVAAGLPYELPPLPEQPRTLEDAPEGSVLELFAGERARQVERAEISRNQQRRNALFKRLDQREAKLRKEMASLEVKRRAAAAREELRVQGELIYATLHELAENDRETEKERAAKLFAEYKKLGSSLPHMAERERAALAGLEAVETLRWEAQRADGEDLRDVEAAVDDFTRRKRGAPSSAQPRKPKRKRKTLEFRTAGGSRIAVGRSPVENAELTFSVARPNDLWFHVRGVPGAHVILSRDDRGSAPEEDLTVAAALAAFYSKARASGTVAVDYTLRKHVRKQRAAPPGLVWYTHAKTIVTQPQSLDSLQQDTVR